MLGSIEKKNNLPGHKLSTPLFQKMTQTHILRNVKLPQVCKFSKEVTAVAIAYVGSYQWHNHTLNWACHNH